MRWPSFALVLGVVLGGCAVEVEPVDPGERELAPATAPAWARGATDERGRDGTPSGGRAPVARDHGAATFHPEPTPWAPHAEDDDEARLWDEEGANPEPTPWQPNEASSNPEPTPWRDDEEGPDPVAERDALVVSADAPDVRW